MKTTTIFKRFEFEIERPTPFGINEIVYIIAEKCGSEKWEFWERTSEDCKWLQTPATPKLIAQAWSKNAVATVRKALRGIRVIESRLAVTTTAALKQCLEAMHEGHLPCAIPPCNETNSHREAKTEWAAELRFTGGIQPLARTPFGPLVLAPVRRFDVQEGTMDPGGGRCLLPRNWKRMPYLGTDCHTGGDSRRKWLAEGRKAP